MRSLHWLGIFAAIVGLSLASSSACARYRRPDLEKVPVEQLVTNLTKLASESPTDAALRMNLARVHAMAYATRLDQLDTLKGSGEKGAWLGYAPQHVPFHVQPTDDKDRLAAAKAHLEKAIARFQEAIKLDPKNLTARLGHAWCLDQAGRKDEAKTAYRDVIEAGWAIEKDLTKAGLGWHSVTAEAAGYLIPLLDPKKDDKELAELKDRVEKMGKVSRPITPIAIPLSAEAHPQDLLDTDARVRFDVDGQCRGAAWSWITPDAGWLVYDRSGSGKITSGLQLFGNVTFWLFWDNGYQALAALDNDGDGRLAGPELAGLAIWRDANSNGVSEPGEVRPLAEHGIVALSCRSQADRAHPKCIAAFSPAGVEFRDGSTRPSYDFVLRPAK